MHWKEAITKLRKRYKRGESHVKFFKLPFKWYAYSTMIILGIKDQLGVSISILWLVPFMIAYPIANFFIGWLDEAKGFWKYENRYNSRELNPHTAKIQEIYEAVCETDNLNEDRASKGDLDG